METITTWATHLIDRILVASKSAPIVLRAIFGRIPLTHSMAYPGGLLERTWRDR
jgi:hypothetical protein